MTQADALPANPSSPIPAALAHLTPTDHRQLQDAEAPHLLAYLAAVPDPRAAGGRRHPLAAILAMAVAAVLAGARSMAAIAEWTADAPQSVRAALGARCDAPGRFAVPSEATIRRALGRLDAQALADAVGAWLAERDRPSRRRRAVAVDGKRLRGARTTAPDGDGRPVHLLAAMDHTSRAVLAQRARRRRSRGGTRFRPAARRARPSGHRRHRRRAAHPPEAAEFLVGGKQAHYLFIVKANQPTLLDRCASLPWHQVPELDRTHDRAHGRVEIRTLKAVSVRHLGFPTPPRSSRSPARPGRLPPDGFGP
jgi:hypothetical protein